MDHQTMLNWIFAGAGAAFGWVLKVIWDAIKDLKADMRQIERDLPEIYVRKDDFKAAVSEMKEDFRELKHDIKDGFNKMDRSMTMLFKRIEEKEDRLISTRSTNSGD